ncbi:Trigger factor [bacterium HR23]|nr:Trigger factor [bacterium HR23]
MELNNYQAIRIPLEPVQVTDEDVQRALGNLRRRFTTWEPVARPAQAGDVLVLSLVGTVEGKEVFREADLPVYMGGENRPLGPQFTERLREATRGEVREFTLPLPDDYPDQSLRGKPCAYRVLVKEVNGPRLPDLDDAFARQVDPSVDGLEALKARLRQRLVEEKESLRQERYRRQALDALRQQAKVEIPPILIEREVDHALEHFEEDLASRGITLQRWLETTGKTLQQVREELQPEAERLVMERLLLDRLAQAEGIQVSTEEVDAELRSLSNRTQRKDRELLRALLEPSGREAVARVIARRKALQRLLQIVSQPSEGEAPPPTETQPQPTPASQ